MDCRARCGACCIAPSISSALPGAPLGKAAGIPCLHLDSDKRCRLFGLPERPLVCGNLQPSREMCGNTPDEALTYLHYLEGVTRPD